MKPIHIRLPIAFLLVALSAGLRAQSFNPAPGYSATALFSSGLGFTVSALDVDSAGDVFYLESGVYDDGGGPVNDTRLYRRSASDGYASPSLLFAFGSNVFGSFVRLSGNWVFFGESSTGTIRSVATTGGSSTLVATVPGNYDLRFSSGLAFLSHNPVTSLLSPPDNRVSLLDTSSGNLTLLVDPGSDYSAPILFDSSGNLVYGATGFGSLAGDVLTFASSDLAEVIAGNRSALGPADGSLLFDNDNNQYLALDVAGRILIADSPFGAPAELVALSGNGTAPIGQTGTGQFFGGLAANAIGAYVGVSSDFLNGPSTVFLVIPEPGSALLFLLSSAALASRRRRGTGARADR